MPLFDLKSVGGTTYNVQNQDTGDIITVKVIKAELLFEIIKAHHLQLEIINGTQHVDLEITQLMTGYLRSPYELTWYTTVTNKINQAEESAVKQACKEGNSIVVLEIIDPKPWEGFKRPIRKKKK